MKHAIDKQGEKKTVRIFKHKLKNKEGSHSSDLNGSSISNTIEAEVQVPLNKRHE